MNNLPKYAGFIQFDVKIGHWQENLAGVKKAIGGLQPPAGSLLVLPELWGAGFDYKKLAEHAEASSQLLAALVDEAAKYDITLAGSLPEAVLVGGVAAFYNTLYFVGRDGVLGKYRKQHLFAPMGENRYFTAGDSPAAANLPFGSAAGLVCFDLRFPELVRQQTGMGAKILVVSAQWPLARVEQWRTLLRARAIENQLYVVACNRCGATDGLDFGGHSMVVAPDGQILLEALAEESCQLVEVEPPRVEKLRKLFNTATLRPYNCPDAGKVKEVSEVAGEVASIKEEGGQVVFTNGCFDILHAGHVTYLEEARRQGDFLVVGLNSDSSVSSIKGPMRPINNQESRARVLAGLGCVDRVVTFAEDTPLNLITALLPNVLVKGADWPIDKIVGGRQVIDAGGKVINIPMVESFSTTGVIEKIKGEV